MLYRIKIWVRRTASKLPMQLSILGWPPLLSHGLALVIGTLILQKGESGIQLPAGRILVPTNKLVQLDKDPKPWRSTQKLTVLLQQGEAWCRTSDDFIKLWKAPGRHGDLYAQWPGANSSRLNQALQKKAAFTTDQQDFPICGASERASPSASAVHYD